MPKSRKKNFRFIVFGYSELAVAALERFEAENLSPELLVTRRIMDPETGKRTRRAPTAVWSREHDLSTVRPADEKKSEWLEPILEDPPDLVLAVGWETPIPQELLDLEATQCIGIHASLLPRYRGRHPLRAALSAGEKKTGLTAYRIEGNDWSGPILMNEELSIGADETYGELKPRMHDLCRSFTVELVEKLASGKKFKEKTQNRSRATTTPRTDRRHRRAPWWGSAQGVYDRLRAYSPEPGLETFLDGKRVEILKGKPMEWLNNTLGDSGTFLGLRSGRIAVLCNGPSVFGIERLRPVGGESISATRFARERNLKVGSSLV